MLQLITHLRLLGVLEVDAGLAEAPGEADTELARAVPRFVVLVVVFGESIPRCAIVAIMEWHDSCGRQYEPVLEEALPQAQEVHIVNAVVGALKSGFPAGDAAEGKSCCPLPKNDVGAEVEGPFHTVILLVQARCIEVIIAQLRRRLEAEPLARTLSYSH